MTLNTIMQALIAELEAGGVPDPLQQRFTLAFVWDDLARLAGEPVPARVARALDAPVADVVLLDRPRRDAARFAPALLD